VWDALILRLPIVGPLARNLAITRFSRTLATLLGSGVQLLEAMDIVRSLLGNVVLEKSVTQARDDIREGSGIANALRSAGGFPPLVTHMIAVGERSGELEQMLASIATSYERDADAAISRLTAAMEPMIIVVMGLGVGFIMVSIMEPIMDLTSSAGR
jgi:general secretion pathway protein F